jgi:heme oxygenase
MNFINGLRAQPGLALRLKDATKALHAQAERSGVVADILHGRIDRPAYALLLRNLASVYLQMELGLEQRRDSLCVKPIAKPEMYRSGSLEADLVGIAGADWQTELELLPSTEIYVARIAAASQGDGALLLAHAYVRYLGDLNGGRMLRRLLARSLELDDASLSFYEFPEIADLDGFKLSFRAALDLAGRRSADVEPILDEARAAFLLNIAMSNEIKQGCAQHAGSIGGMPASQKRFDHSD